LYSGDEGVLHQGVLRAENLVTTRVGEMVFSHWRGRAIAADDERVAVALGAGEACPFWQRQQRQCAIYELRPAQCRAQKCWDTSDADKLMRWPSLTRRDLLDEADPLLAVLDEHDRACDPAELAAVLQRAGKGDTGAEAAAAALIDADRRLRRRVVHQELAPMEALPFLLGRPLQLMTQAWGYTVNSGWGGKIQLRRVPRS
jgi:Fe-S-cluster containining protein